MRLNVLLTMSLVLGISACTQSGSDSSGGPSETDRKDYEKLQSREDWSRYVTARDRDLRVQCGSSYACDNSSATEKQLQRRFQAVKRLRDATNAARVSGLFKEREARSLEYEVKRLTAMEQQMYRDLTGIRTRRAKQDKIMARLNALGCNVTRDDSTETSEFNVGGCLPNNNSTNSIETLADLLQQLEESSVSTDRSRLVNLENDLKNTSGKIAKMAAIQKRFNERGFILKSGQLVGPGHPFGGMSENSDLQTYADLAKQYSRSMKGTEECLAPVCERTIYEAAAMCTNLPGTTVTAEGLRNWLTLTKPTQLTAMGIENVSFRDFTSTNEGGLIRFTRLFSGLTVSVAVSSSGTDCGTPASILYMIQEAQGIVDILPGLSGQNVREIRFVRNRDTSDRFVTGSRLSDGGVRLDINVLERSRDGLSVARVRELVYSQIPDALRMQ